MSSKDYAIEFIAAIKYNTVQIIGLR